MSEVKKEIPINLEAFKEPLAAIEMVELVKEQIKGLKFHLEERDKDTYSENVIELWLRETDGLHANLLALAEIIKPIGAEIIKSVEEEPTMTGATFLQEAKERDLKDQRFNAMAKYIYSYTHMRAKERDSKLTELGLAERGLGFCSYQPWLIEAAEEYREAQK